MLVVGSFHDKLGCGVSVDGKVKFVLDFGKEGTCGGGIFVVVLGVIVFSVGGSY